MTLDFTDGKSTLVQVMAWCPQATSHHLSQCWPRSMSPNGVTRPQWVNQHVWTTFKFTISTVIFNKMLGVNKILCVMIESSYPGISYMHNETKNSHFSCDVYMRKEPSNYFRSSDDQENSVIPRWGDQGSHLNPLFRMHFEKIQLIIWSISFY